MPFIGNQPAEKYSSFQKQDFTTSATTSYTLDHPVANQNEIALFINFVRQEPTTAYTASGTSLTLTSATSSSDDMYCVYLGKAVQTVNPPSGSVGSSQVAASIITGQTALGATPADTDELLISDAGTLKRVDYSYLKVDNTPAFFARRTDQGITENSFVKVVFSTEDIDTDNAFDSSTGRFTVPSGKAGKYYFSAIIGLDAMGANHFYFGEAKFYKNGSALGMSSSLNYANGYGAQGSVALSTIQDLSVGDYIEVYAYLDDASDTTVKVNNAFFSGYKLIG